MCNIYSLLLVFLLCFSFIFFVSVSSLPLRKRPFKVKDGGVHAIDVDDTLIMWKIPDGYKGPLVETNYNGFKDVGIPNQHAIDHLKKMKARSYSIVIWSAGGSDWANAAVKALGIEDYVDVIMPKIDSHLDDVPDPADKIGRWHYVNLEGTFYSKDKDGNPCVKKNGIIHPYGKAIGEKEVSSNERKKRK